MKTLRLTRRASPEDLQEDSDWQKSATEVAAGARVSLNKLQRRFFSMALTRAQAERELALQNNLNGKNHATVNPSASSPESTEGDPITRTPAGLVVKELFENRKFSSLTRLVRVIAWVWRAATKWKTKFSATNKAKLKTNPSKEETVKRKTSSDFSWEV